MSFPIPPSARKVFSGVVFDVWHWDQEMFDGTIRRYERLVRADSVSVIPVVGGMIMIQHQEQPAREPFISFPGGGVEQGADRLVEAQREFLEETGYASDDVTLFKIFRPSQLIVWNSCFFIAKDCKRVSEPTPEPGEKITLEFISFDDLLALADNPLFRHKDLEATLVRARYNDEKRRELHTLLYGS